MVKLLHVGVVGGGFGGAAVAAALLERLAPGSSITVFEPAAELAGGTAYGQCAPHHLLNVSEEKPRALPDSSRSFAAWVQRSKGAAAEPYRQDDGSYYYPRQWFGEYMRSELAWRQSLWGERVRLVHVRYAACVISSAESGGVCVAARDGKLRTFDVVILALGNSPAVALPMAPLPRAFGAQTESMPHVVQDPWAPEAMARLVASGAQRIVIAGSGLTMADVVTSLQREGYAGQVLALSRNGYMPQRSKGRTPGFVADGFPSCATLTDVVRGVRAWCDESQQALGDWRPGLEFARLNVPRLWGRLPALQRRRFRGRLRALWEMHRYQMPPSVHDALAEWLHRGQLTVRRAEVLGITPGGVAIRQAGRTELLACDAVVNATGPDRSFATSHVRLAHLLEETGLDGLLAEREGLTVSAHGEVCGVTPVLQGRLWAAGTIVRSTFGEMTTVTDIGVLVQRLADHLVERLTLPVAQPLSDA